MDTWKQGCGVGVETGVGVDRSRPFWPESESELESVKFCRLRLRPGVAGYHPSGDGYFGRAVMHRLENIGRLEEKERGSVEMKLECHLVIKFGLKRVSEIILDQRERCVAVSTHSKTVIQTTFKGISDNQGRLDLQLARTRAVLPYHPFGCNEK